MGLRITNLEITRTFINQIFEQREALENARNKVSSGLEVENPGDDPARASTIAEFRSALNRLDSHQKRIATVRSTLETQESALNDANDLLVRAKEIATEAANSGVTPTLRASMSEEVFQLRDQLVSLANTKYLDLYVWGGADTNQPPFEPSSTAYTNPASATDPAHDRYVYNSSAAAQVTRTVDLSDNESIRIDTAGDDVFSDAISAVERLARALAGYRSDPEDFSTNPTGTGAQYSFPADAASQTDQILRSIGALESARQNSVVSETMSLGGRLNRVQQAEEIVGTIKLNTETARASIQDADIFEAAANLTNLEISLQGLLTAGARINQLSLLNYL